MAPPLGPQRTRPASRLIRPGASSYSGCPPAAGGPLLSRIAAALALVLGVAALGALAGFWLGSDAPPAPGVGVATAPPVPAARPAPSPPAAATPLPEPDPQPGASDPATATAEAASAEGMPPRTSLAVRLIGTVTGASPQDGSALIVDVDQATTMRRVGDRIAGGAARIVEIGPQRVLLDHRGRRELLVADTGRDANRPPPPSGLDALTAEELFEMPEAELERLLDGSRPKELRVPLDQAMAGLSSEGVFAPDPESGAIAIQALPRRSALGRLGHAPGDRIVEIDGSEVRSLESGLRSLAESLYSTGGNTILTLQRADGSRVQLATESGALLPPELTAEPAPRR